MDGPIYIIAVRTGRRTEDVRAQTGLGIRRYLRRRLRLPLAASVVNWFVPDPDSRRIDPSAAPTYTVDDWLAAAGPKNGVANVPGRIVGLVSALRTAPPSQLNTNDPVATRVADRQAAVLVLLKDASGGPEVVLLQRSSTLRHHPGEIAFPGGARESTDRDPAATALREAAEEIGLDSSSVDPLITLPRLHIGVSDFDVTAVIALWRQPGPVNPVNPAETHRVLTVALPDLDNPDRWHQYQCKDWSGPATFLDGGARLWGYTAEILLYMSRNS